MKSGVLLPLILSTFVVGTASAFELKEGATLGTTAQEIKSALSAEGYDLLRFQKSAALIQVQAAKDGERYVLFLNARTGEVMKAQSNAGTEALVVRTAGSEASRPGVASNDLRDRLQAEGYEIIKIEHEADEIEVYARRDGQLWELKLDPRTGQILKVEAED